MFTRIGTEILKQVQESQGEEMVQDFLQMMNRWHSMQEVKDNTIDIYLKQCEILALENEHPYDGITYFSPSSADACERSLYERLKGAKRDKDGQEEYQGRWQRIGTKIGEIIQRDLLFIAKHYEKKTGEAPPFKPMFVPYNLPNRFNITKVPAWEAFVEKRDIFEYEGFEIPIKGQPDGILTYKDGRRIGLEIKSKQGSYSKTSEYSMRGIENGHRKQVVAYSLLYDLDEYLVIYLNASKKSWKLKEEDKLKYPDLRAFYTCITKEDQYQLLDYFLNIKSLSKESTPPKLDMNKWTFNNYKQACIQSLSIEELVEIEQDYKQLYEVAKKMNKIPSNLQNQLDNYTDFYEAYMEYLPLKAVEEEKERALEILQTFGGDSGAVNYQ